MQINLRKASIVQDFLHSEVSRLKTEPSTVHANLFEDNICEQVEQQFQAFLAAQTKIDEYLKARQVIRSLVARYNVEVGVHDLLAEDSMLATRESVLKSQLRSAQARLSDEAVKRQAERLRDQEDLEITMSLDVIPPQHLEEMKSSLERARRQRRKIKDRLVTINVGTEVEVPDHVAKVLEDLGLD